MSQILSPQVEGAMGVRRGRGSVAQQGEWVGELPFWRLMTGAANRMGGGSRRKEEKERQKETDTEKHTVTHDQGRRQTWRKKQQSERQSDKETEGSHKKSGK